MITIRHFQGATVDRVAPDELDGAVAGGGWVWVDLSEPTAEEAAILESASLSLDPLTIEDMRDDRHMPKVDIHPEELSLTVHGVALAAADQELDTLELDIAVKPGLLVSYHEQELAAVTEVGRRLDRRGGRGFDRPVLVLHLVLDTMNDVFVPFMDHLDKRIDIVEEDILSDPTEQTRYDIYELQRDVIQLRRALVPQAEVVRRLGRERVGLVAEEDRVLFLDVYDHLYRMSELCGSYLALLESAMTSYRSALDDRLNDMLRVLTLVSVVFLPITMLAGIYGMNFEHMPELGIAWAYPALWGVFALIPVLMALWFRRRGWIGRSAERAAEQRRRGLSQVLEIPVLGQVLRVPVAGAKVGAEVVARTGRGLARASGIGNSRGEGPSQSGTSG